MPAPNCAPPTQVRFVPSTRLALIVYRMEHQGDDRQGRCASPNKQSPAPFAALTSARRARRAGNL